MPWNNEVYGISYMEHHFMATETKVPIRISCRGGGGGGGGIPFKFDRLIIRNFERNSLAVSC